MEKDSSEALKIKLNMKKNQLLFFFLLGAYSKIAQKKCKILCNYIRIPIELTLFIYSQHIIIHSIDWEYTYLHLHLMHFSASYTLATYISRVYTMRGGGMCVSDQAIM